MSSTAISVEGFRSFPEEQSSPSITRLPPFEMRVVEGMEPALSNMSPLWERGALSQLASIIILEKNWDSYGANPIEWSRVYQTFDLLHSVMDHDTPAPVLVPMTSGSIQLEWHTLDIDLEVELLSNTSIAVWYEDGLHRLEPFDDVLHYDVTPLADVLRELARRSRQR
ncbi:MAG: hypothetical protein OXH52_13490 [Gammaproteobacteria bacterium]|nr:hypothetical protein [Gammaproteobacteria bacterium]